VRSARSAHGGAAGDEVFDLRHEVGDPLARELVGDLGAQVGRGLLEGGLVGGEDGVHAEEGRAEIGGDRAHDVARLGGEDSVGRSAEVSARDVAEVGVGKLEVALLHKVLEGGLARVEPRAGVLRRLLGGHDEALHEAALLLHELVDALVVEVADGLVLHRDAVLDHAGGEPGVADLARLGSGEEVGAGLIEGAQLLLGGPGAMATWAVDRAAQVAVRRSLDQAAIVSP
jgi:hypothetical protein